MRTYLSPMETALIAWVKAKLRYDQVLLEDNPAFFDGAERQKLCEDEQTKRMKAFRAGVRHISKFGKRVAK